MSYIHTYIHTYIYIICTKPHCPCGARSGSPQLCEPTRMHPQVITDICGIQCNVVIFDLTTGSFHDNSIHAEAYKIGIIISLWPCNNGGWSWIGFQLKPCKCCACAYQGEMDRGGGAVIYFTVSVEVRGYHSIAPWRANDNKCDWARKKKDDGVSTVH
jgi:hypothetical protein